jgi:hypothetical protein
VSRLTLAALPLREELMFSNREWWFLGPFIAFVLALVVIGVLV